MTTAASSSARGADELLADWERRSLLALLAHARSANRCAAWDTRLGTAATALTAIVGTSIFATLRNDVDVAARVVVGGLTITAAVSTAVHTFAALPQRKEAYEQASRRHAAVRRRIESVRARLVAGVELDVWAEIELIRADLEATAVATPNASRRIWDTTRRQMKGQYTWHERVAYRVRGLRVPLPLGDPADVGGPRSALEPPDPTPGGEPPA